MGLFKGGWKQSERGLRGEAGHEDTQKSNNENELISSRRLLIRARAISWRGERRCPKKQMRTRDEHGNVDEALPFLQSCTQDIQDSRILRFQIVAHTGIFVHIGA